MRTSPQLVCSTAAYCAFGSMVSGGGLSNVAVFGGCDGFRSTHLTAELDDDAFDWSSSLFEVTEMITRITATMTRGIARLRAVRHRLRRFSASIIAWRRMSRFWRWRSRL